MTRMGGPVLACFLLVLLWGLGVRVAKEWPSGKPSRAPANCRRRWKRKWKSCLILSPTWMSSSPTGKIAEKPYWKERLELKARLVATLKKAPPALLESYAIRHTPR